MIVVMNKNAKIQILDRPIADLCKLKVRKLYFTNESKNSFNKPQKENLGEVVFEFFSSESGRSSMVRTIMEGGGGVPKI